MTYLNLISPHEEIKMMDKNEGLYITNTGRIYSVYTDCKVDSLNGVFIFGNKVYSIKYLQERFFPNTQLFWTKQTFIYHNIDLRNYIQDRLTFYLGMSDEFMLYLIENNKKVTFDEALMEFSQYKFNLINFSRQTIYSLLKPVYYRYEKYTKNDKNSLLGLADSIKYPKQPKTFPKEIILYDVPCIVNNSKLQLLDDFELDLTDMNENSCYCRELRCLYLGNIHTFKFVKIKPFFQRKGFDQGYYFEIELTGEGNIFR